MKRYLHIINLAFPTISESDLYTSISEINIDSLGIIILRVELEKHFNFEISDSVWYQFQTLAEALEYFHRNKNEKKTKNNITKRVNLSEHIEIRMPQMANNALSESWLLKYLGDIHWVLLSKGLGQKLSLVADDYGQRLYATFVRISYSISPLSQFKENEFINFKAEIKAFGNNMYLSSIQGQSGINQAEATLMTTFSFRESNDNSQIVKSIPLTKNNYIEQLKQQPVFINDYRLLKKGLLDEIPSKHGIFQNTSEKLFSCISEIHPYYEINGVGLLYFASYPIIADKCLLEYFIELKSHSDFIYSYHTIYRDIFYYGNTNPSDKLSFQLNSLIEKDNQIKYSISLYSHSDNRLLAKILTVKQNAGI